MFVGMHFFTPVVIAASVDLGRALACRPRWFSGKALFSIGICGILPDLVDPHIRLSARLSSWSHTIWFVASLFPFCLLWGLFHRNMRGAFTAFLCWFAVGLHLFCDGISGGIAPYYPQGTQKVGASYFPYSQWIKADILITLLAAALITVVIVLNRYKRKKKRLSNKKNLLELMHQDNPIKSSMKEI